MPTAQSIIEYVQELSGHPLNRDEGVHAGSADDDVERLMICWTATADALRHAGESGVDTVLCHESLFYPYCAEVKEDNPPGWEDWPTNRQRRDLMQKHGLTVMRVHGSLDDICIFDDFAALLSLGEPVEAEGRAKVYEIAPCPLSLLVAHVKEATGLPAVRVSAPNGLDQQVHRVGLPWGGMGLSTNIGYQQNMIGRGCDVFIAGESDSYGFRFSAECGVPLIETGHEISENPGLRHFAKMLQARFPELEVSFYECKPPCRVM